MAFRANQRDEERKLSSSIKAKFGSLEDFSPLSPALDKSRVKVKAGRNEPFSPDLRPRAAQPELMFNMDDEEAPDDSPSVRPQRSSDLKRQSELDQIPSLSGSYREEKGKSVYRPLMLSPEGGPSLASPQEMGAQSSAKPWASAKLPTDKLDLREIMHEASPGQGKSALSAGIAAQKAKEAAAKPQQPKLSQKERKRQQLLQAEQAALIPPVKAAWEKASTSSPWQTVSSGSKSFTQESPVEAPKSVPSNTKPLVVAEAPTKSVPRQTQSPDTRHSGQSRTPIRTPPARPSPKPASSMSNFSADMSSKPVVPHSKSYFKPAPKAEPILGLSMADIIDQERRNLESVKEAAAKRSLEEIQQEQAFQEWWEEESRRTQEEEAKRSARDRDRGAEKGGAKGRRGGRGGKARGERGGNNTSGGNAGVADAGAEGEAVARPQNQDQGRGGRGNRRSRARGGAVKASS